MMNRMGSLLAPHRPRPAQGRLQRPPPLLGIDPGLRRTGYAVLGVSAAGDRCRVIEAGVVRLEAGQAIEQRLAELDRSLAALLEAHRPDVLVCEQLYAHYKHPRTAILMAHARGVILALAARHGLSVISVGATQVKKYLTGSGRAGKCQIQRAIAATLRLPRLPQPHDVADALAVALCGWHVRAARSRLDGRSRRAQR